jgi:pimeloyl-ACP methyl ester carboxylesterase
MSRFVLIPGFGGPSDFDFVAPMLAREHEVSVVQMTDARSRGGIDTDTVLVGYSLGAVIAAAHAAAHPVAALVLICGWAHPTTRLLDWTRHANDQAFARHTMVGPGSDRAPIVRPELLGLVDTLPVANLGDIGCPTLVIGARYDIVATAHQSRLLHGGIADSHYAELPTGHAALVERPAEVLSLLSSFAAHPSVAPVASR